MDEFTSLPGFWRHWGIRFMVLHLITGDQGTMEGVCVLRLEILPGIQ